MTDNDVGFRLEPSGAFPCHLTEMKWKDLPRKKITGHPMVFAGLKLTPPDGREIELIRMHQDFIYAYRLHPTMFHPAHFVSSAVEEVRTSGFWMCDLPIVLPPTLFVSDHPMHVSEDDPESCEDGKCISLPRVRVIAEFQSNSPARDSEMSFSSLIVIWFQDNFGEIPSEIHSQLSGIDWNSYACDWTP